MLLENKTAIVYGGSGAVGSAVAKAFAREGARVFLAARNRDKLQAVAAEIRATGGRAEVAPVDATDKDAVEAHQSFSAPRRIHRATRSMSAFASGRSGGMGWVSSARIIEMLKGRQQ